MEELFFIGKDGNRTKVFFLHKSKDIKTVWQLGKRYEQVARSSNIRLDRVQPERLEGETEHQWKSKKPRLHLIEDGKTIMQLNDVKFFAEDFSSFLGSGNDEIFFLGRNQDTNLEFIFFVRSKKGTKVWKMTNKGFEIVAEGKDISFSRFQHLSIREMDGLSEDERRRVKSLPPRLHIDQGGHTIIELLTTRLFIESSPMRIDFR